MSATAPLFASPDPDEARTAFAEKPRGLIDKVMTVAEAVRRFVHDGDYLATGGFGTNRIPNAVCHELLRQRRQDPGFSGHTATHDFRYSAPGNLTGRGQALARPRRRLRRRPGRPEASRPRPARSGVGHCPCVEWSIHPRGAIPRRPWACHSSPLGVSWVPTRWRLAKVIECPYTKEKLVAIPALYPDVAAIHVHEADRFGSCRFSSTSVADVDLARAPSASSSRANGSFRTRMRANRTAPSSRSCALMPCARSLSAAIREHARQYFSDEDHLKTVAGSREGPGCIRTVPRRPHLRGRRFRRVVGSLRRRCSDATPPPARLLLHLGSRRPAIGELRSALHSHLRGTLTADRSNSHGTPTPQSRAP